MAVRWFSMSTQFLTDPKVEDLGEKFGPSGPLVIVALLGRAKIANDAGRVNCSFRTLGNEAFTDRAEVREILIVASESGLVEIEDLADAEVSLRFPAFRRWQDAGRKADEREAKKPARKAKVQTRPEVSGPVPTDKTDRQDKTDKTEKRSAAVSATDAPLSHLLADLVAANDPDGKRPTVTQRWATEEDRMLRLDNRKPEEARRLIEWTQADSFWRGNVLSMPRFREQYGRLYQAAVAANQQARGQPKLSPAQKRAQEVRRKREERQAA